MRIIQFSLTIDSQAFNHGDGLADYSGYIRTGLTFTARRRRDGGYGLVCTIDGTVLPGYLLSGANQEHGIVSREGGPDADVSHRFPVGTRLRILPNHACATGAQFPEYRALAEGGKLTTWERFHGW